MWCYDIIVQVLSYCNLDIVVSILNKEIYKRIHNGELDKIGWQSSVLKDLVISKNRIVITFLKRILPDKKRMGSIGIRKLLVDACKNFDFPIFQIIYEECKRYPNFYGKLPKIVCQALDVSLCKHDHNAIKYFCDPKNSCDKHNGYPIYEYAIETLGKSCNNLNFSVVNLLMKNSSFSQEESTIGLAKMSIETGRLDIFKLLVMQYNVKFDNSLDDTILSLVCMENGDLEFIKFLHVHKKMDFNKTCLFQYAAGKDQLEVVEFLLEDPTIDPSVNNNAAIKAAIKYCKKLEIIKLLLKDKRVNPSVDDNFAIRNIIIWSVPNNIILEKVKLLLQDGRVNPAANNNELVTEASRCPGLLELLLQHKQVDPSVHKNKAITTACKCENSKDIELLLNDQRVNPCDNYNSAILCAIDQSSHSDIERLLKDPRIIATYNQLVWQSVYKEIKYNALDYLLKEGKADPNATHHGENAIHFAIAHNHFPCLNLLLKSGKVDPTANENSAIRYCCKLNQDNMLKLLLSDKRVDPSVKNNALFLFACENSRVQIVTTLLNDKRVDPTVLDNRGIFLIFLYGRHESVELLMENNKINPFNRPLKNELEKASEKEQAEFFASLLYE